MRSKELSVELRDRIVSRHRSGEGYQNISAALKVTKNTVASIILKLKKFGTTNTLPSHDSPLGVCQKAPKDFQTMRNKILWSDETKILAKMPSVTSGGNLASSLRRSMVVAASRIGDFLQQQGLADWSE